MGKRQDPKVDLCRICNKMGHWVKDWDQRKEPAKEQAEVKTVSCSVVSPYQWEARPLSARQWMQKERNR